MENETNLSRSLSSGVAGLKRVMETEQNDVYSTNYSDYVIQEVIGYGSSAMVKRAVYKPTGRVVAVKIIELEKFERNHIEDLRVLAI